MTAIGAAGRRKKAETGGLALHCRKKGISLQPECGRRGAGRSRNRWSNLSLLFAMMKKYRSFLFAIAVLGAGCSSDSSEPAIVDPGQGQVTLYDAGKESVAYIDYPDDATIYLFDGEPVAFIRSEELVFSFNGRFLGWYRDGVLYDRTTYAVGARHDIVRGAINTAVTFPDKMKGVKRPKPLKPNVEDAFARPVLYDSWSEQTLTAFFEKGKK